MTFINPFTDFGFKKLFGENANKTLLVDFLNALLRPIPDGADAQARDLTVVGLDSPIVDLHFREREQLGVTEYVRKAVFDIHARTSAGERIIIEMQKARQNFFRDRSVFYSTFPIQEQAEKGNWNFRLSPVYCIGILDFRFGPQKQDASKTSEGSASQATESRDSRELFEPAAEHRLQHGECEEADHITLEHDVLHVVTLKDHRNGIFFKKLTFVYVEMPNFTKNEGELDTRLDKWLFFLKHLSEFDDIPHVFGNEPVFSQAFQISRLAAFTQPERDAYEESLKHYRDLNNVISTAAEEAHADGWKKGLEKGLAEGRKEGLAEAVTRLVAAGMSEAQARALLGDL